jgi:hypothetical protein
VEQLLQIPHLQSSVASNDEEHCGGSTGSQLASTRNDSLDSGDIGSAVGAGEAGIITPSGMLDIGPVRRMTLEDAFDDYIPAFAHTSARQELFCQEATIHSSIDGVKRTIAFCETAVPITMRRGEAEAPRNNQKRRLLPTNEKMRNSSRKTSHCSLCWSTSHRPKGSKCEVVSRYEAFLVESNDVPDMAAGIGITWLISKKMLRSKL